ncbi:MAG: hypothetical protein ACF8OB_00370 [Phycisphaeraceae bacterium JB051]
MENNVPPLGEEPALASSPVPPSYQQQPAPHVGAQSSWPTVIGIISIIFGSLGALGSVYQAVAPFLMGMAAGFVPEDDEQARVMFESMAKWKFPLMGVGIVNLIFYIILIVCGAKLVGHHAAASSLHKKWAIAKILFSLVGVTITTMAQISQMRLTMQQQSQAMGGGGGAQFFETAMMVAMVVAVLMGLVFACAYPVFVLIWFSREKVKNEVQSWEEPIHGMV